eukprot:237069_1
MIVPTSDVYQPLSDQHDSSRVIDIQSVRNSSRRTSKCAIFGRFLLILGSILAIGFGLWCFGVMIGAMIAADVDSKSTLPTAHVANVPEIPLRISDSEANFPESADTEADILERADTFANIPESVSPVLDSGAQPSKTDISSISWGVFAKLAQNKPTENVVFSGWSLAGALKLLRAGSEGKTKEEIEKFLGQDFADTKWVSKANSEYYVDLTEAYSMLSAYPLKDSFAKLAKSDFSATAEYYDKTNQSSIDKVFTDVNGWVKKETRGKVHFSLTKKELKQSDLILVNAVYMSMFWQNPFESYPDKPCMKFQTPTNKAFRAKRMSGTEFGVIFDGMATIQKKFDADVSIFATFIMPDESTDMVDFISKFTDER